MLKRSLSSSPHDFLPIDFLPGPNDVICARGKDASNHSGNKVYRRLLQSYREPYQQTTCKYEKTMIVTEIVSRIESNGGFVRHDASSGLYFLVGDAFAREKVGQNLRDSLGNQYKSSTKAKRSRRNKYNANMFVDIERIIQSNGVVANKMNALSCNLQRRNGEEQDYYCSSSDDDSSEERVIQELFSNANKDILEAFKKDARILERFTQAENFHKQQ